MMTLAFNPLPPLSLLMLDPLVLRVSKKPIQDNLTKKKKSKSNDL